MIKNLAYSLIYGKPLVAYLGVVTFSLLLATALVGLLNFKGIRVIPFKWHPRLAVLTIISAIIHAVFALSIYFNF